MVMNPVDRIQTVWIRPDLDFAGSSKVSSYLRIRPESGIRIQRDPEKTPDIRPDPAVHL